MHQHTQQFAPVRQPWLFIGTGLLALAAAFAAAAGESAAFGFSPAQFPRQQALELRFDAELNPADLREALDAGRWDEANQYAAITAAVLASYCDRLEELTALLKRDSR